MLDFSNLSRSLVSMAGALLISAACITAAVGPVKAATPGAATAVSDASTPAR